MVAEPPHEPAADLRPLEVASTTVVCPECGEAVKLNDVHAFVLGLHQRVCGELAQLNGANE